MVKPDLLWQKGKYPSLKPAFDFGESLLTEPDPRNEFGKIADREKLPRPSTWSNAAIGPQKDVSARNDVPGQAEITVSSATELVNAIRNATPGETITIKPGEYLLSGRSIEVTPAGSITDPIVLRAQAFGSVRLLLNTLEGFHVRGSHWIFENLIINGVCPRDAKCEHAFHVVGDARGIVIRNNWISSFNAALKVNGSNGRFPDDGRVANNVFVNDMPRQTTSPVTPVDIVGASNWTVEGNYIADFAKAQGDRISYGAFFKGGGTNNVFERNLVRCERRHRGGTRIGFSFGGGGTDRSACRDGRCPKEQTGGVMRNNIVMNCPNDVGVYLSKSGNTRIDNNLLIDTRGIDVRFPESTATVRNNVIDGRIYARDGGTFTAAGNVMSDFQAALNRDISNDYFEAPRTGNLTITDRNALATKGVDISGLDRDICNREISERHRHVGPFSPETSPPCISEAP